MAESDRSFSSDEDVIPSPTPSPPRSIDQKKKRNKTVIVEGNIGCGKTTFLNYFRQFKQVEIHPEPVSEWINYNGNNALELLYTDAERWCFAFEAMVSLSMLNHHKSKVESNKIKMLERSIYSAKYCFAENFRVDGVMADVEYAILNEMHSYLEESEDLSVDLIVYLRASPEVCFQRLHKRNRTEETGVPIEYLKKLHNLHDEWLIHGTRGKRIAPVLVLDANKDLCKLQQDIENMKHEIIGCFD